MGLPHRIQPSFLAFLLVLFCLLSLGQARPSFFGTTNAPETVEGGNNGDDFELFTEEEILLNDSEWVEHGRMLADSTMDYSQGGPNHDHDQGNHNTGDGGKKHGSGP